MLDNSKSRWMLIDIAFKWELGYCYLKSKVDLVGRAVTSQG